MSSRPIAFNATNMLGGKQTVSLPSSGALPSEQLMKYLKAAKFGQDRQGTEVHTGHAGYRLPGSPYSYGGACAVPDGRVNGLRRTPNIPDVLTCLDNVTVPAGQDIVLFFINNATNAAGAAPWTIQANRQFIQGQNNPRNLDGLYYNMWLTSVNPVCEVTIAPAGGVIDRDASERATDLFAANFGFIIDPTGTGTNLALNATLIEDIPANGISLDADQVYRIGNNSFCEFQQIGVGEYQNFGPLGGISFGNDVQMTVRFGVKANVSVTNPYSSSPIDAMSLVQKGR